jgi:predicted O-methyltransferase YrrM
MNKQNIIKQLKMIVKNTPLLGGFLLLIYRFYQKSLLKNYFLAVKDEKNARHILKQIFPENKEIDKLLSKLKKSKLFNTSFSYGHAGNFDVYLLYICALLLKPELVVETGVASGRSSAFQLLALKENDFGMLHSIDLPQHFETKPNTYIVEGNNELDGFVPKGSMPGWLIPDELRNRWKLYLGRSSDLLPEILIEQKSIDIFYHDSDHSYNNMMFEYKTIWPHLRSGGLLISDDIKWNKAFDDFIEVNKISKFFKYRSFGIIIKS